MQVTINFDWVSSATTNDSFDLAEEVCIENFKSFLKYFPKAQESTATITPLPRGERADALVSVGTHLTLWELKTYRKYDPKYDCYMIKVNKLESVKKAIEKYQPEKSYYCMFAPTIGYAFYIDFETIIEKVNSNQYQIKQFKNKKTTVGENQDVVMEDMIFIPINDFKKIKYTKN